MVAVSLKKFFFQAEDGIRDHCVTGVQTCALPISHQTIERILIGFNFNKKHKPWTLSGYYLFDSLWVKIEGKWKYLLALFDIKMNTIVSFDLVESEGSKTIYDFINKSTRNQPKKSITTD